MQHLTLARGRTRRPQPLRLRPSSRSRAPERKVDARAKNLSFQFCCSVVCPKGHYVYNENVCGRSRPNIIDHVMRCWLQQALAETTRPGPRSSHPCCLASTLPA
eukprot:scaffold999_cov30-Phaeocystis_antarctica.AAC.1